jgi:hypothetical protein
VLRARCGVLSAAYTVLSAGCWVLLSATLVVAQDRPFLFSVTTMTADPSKASVRIDYDVGAGERAFQSDTGNQPEQRVGIQATRGRFTLLGRVGLVSAGSSYQSSQAGEVLVSLFEPGSASFNVAAGGGVLHEADGVDVLLGHVVAGRESDVWRLHGNLLFQKPLASDRDAVDLITTFGWARKLTSAIALGVEGMAEDLEGFWDPNEAEGGARLLVGPSLHIAPAGRSWQFNATGGPAFHPSDTGRASSALRDLPPTAKRTGYAARFGLMFRLF